MAGTCSFSSNLFSMNSRGFKWKMADLGDANEAGDCGAVVALNWPIECATVWATFGPSGGRSWSSPVPFRDHWPREDDPISIQQSTSLT